MAMTAVGFYSTIAAWASARAARSQEASLRALTRRLRHRSRWTLVLHSFMALRRDLVRR